MNQEIALLWICIAFTAALVVQVIVLLVMAVTSWRMRNEVKGLAARVEPVLVKMSAVADASQTLLADVRRYASEASEKTNQLLDMTHQQLGRVDDILAEATSRTRTQMDRIEMVMDDTVNRFQETTSLVQSGIVRPLRQLNALTAGLRAGLSFLAGGRRTTVEDATHDEEMFI